MRSLVWFTRLAPSPLAAEVGALGFTIREAIAVSEVLHLCEQHDITCVIIDADVEDAAAKEIALHRMTLRLKPGATVADIVWELSGLFPDAPVQ